MVTGRKFRLSAIIVLFGILLLSSQSTSQTVRASTQTIIFTAHGQPYNFTLTTNSTWNQVITNFGETKFNFTVTGTSGQHGYANVTLCKTSGFFPHGQAKPQNIKIYLNGTRVADNTIQVESINPSQKMTCIWVYWTYHYSTNTLTVDVSLAVPLQAPTFDGTVPLLAVTILSTAGYALSKQRILRRK